jgi:hypothetical protein
MYILAHPTARARAIIAVTDAPEGYVVVIKPPSRNLDQNAKLHSLIGEIAMAVEWAGKLRDAETWKRLVVASWLRAEGESIEVLPALDGKGVDLVYSPTSSLSKAQCSSLIEFIQAWMAERPEFAQ